LLNFQEKWLPNNNLCHFLLYQNEQKENKMDVKSLEMGEF